MKISIITVCYNSESTIEDTIKSVLSQDYDDIEYIIIDGGSKDGTIGIVDNYADRIAKIVSEPDKGIYDAMNKGIGLATGELIGILNSDDFYVSNDVLSSIASKFMSSPEIEATIADVVFVEEADKDTFVTKRYYSAKSFSPWKMRFGVMPPHLATFLRSSTAKKLGSYKLNLKSASDFEYFVRLFCIEKTHFCYIPRVLVAMRLGGFSTSGIKSYLRTINESVLALKFNGIYSNLLFCLFKFPSKLLQSTIFYTRKFSINKKFFNEGSK